MVVSNAFFVKRYLTNCSKSEVETLHLCTVWSEAMLQLITQVFARWYHRGCAEDPSDEGTLLVKHVFCCHLSDSLSSVDSRSENFLQCSDVLLRNTHSL